MFLKFIKNRKLKRQKKELKWSDLYEIDNMSLQELSKNKKRYIRNSIVRIISGCLILVTSLLILVIFWNDIF